MPILALKSRNAGDGLVGLILEYGPTALENFLQLKVGAFRTMFDYTMLFLLNKNIT